MDSYSSNSSAEISSTFRFMGAAAGFASVDAGGGASVRGGTVCAL